MSPRRAVQQRRTLLHDLGERARALREGRHLSRRALAERSGVSERFLAQLEGGEGNISVARLAEVARALEVPLGSLLGSPGVSPARARVEALIGDRSDGELEEVGRWIEARFVAPAAPVIALLGLRGAGKSTVGRRLGERLGLPFVELDARIEGVAALSLAEIFELHGEAYYRRLERETLTALLAVGGAAVLATGGSLVNDPETYRLLRRRATTVWLRARPEDHWNRVVQQGDQRPMARHPDAMAELRALLAAREHLYGLADLTIDTSALSVDEVVGAVARAVGARRR